MAPVNTRVDTRKRRKERKEILKKKKWQIFLRKVKVILYFYKIRAWPRHTLNCAQERKNTNSNKEKGQICLRRALKIILSELENSVEIDGEFSLSGK